MTSTKRCPLCFGLRVLGACDYTTMQHCEKCCREGCVNQKKWVPVNPEPQGQTGAKE